MHTNQHGGSAERISGYFGQGLIHFVGLGFRSIWLQFRKKYSFLLMSLSSFLKWKNLENFKAKPLLYR